MKAFQQQQRAQKHYKRILSAKPSINSKERTRVIYSRNDPIKQFQYKSNNIKLVGKLKQIYDSEAFHHVGGPAKNNWQPNRKSTLVSEYRKKQYETILDQNNFKMLKRIMEVKPTISSNWKQRQKKLSSYSKISSKSVRKTSKERGKDDSLFNQFQRKLMRSAGRTFHLEQNESGKKKRKRRRLIRTLQ